MLFDTEVTEAVRGQIGRCWVTAGWREILFCCRASAAFPDAACLRAGIRHLGRAQLLTHFLYPLLLRMQKCVAFSLSPITFPSCLPLRPPERELTVLCSAEEGEEGGGGCLQADNTPQMVERGCKRVREQERTGWSGRHLSLLEKSEEAAPGLREDADLAHCGDGNVGPIRLLPQAGLKRSRFFFRDTQQDVLWRARCL